MTNPAYEATNSDVAHLINEAKQSSFVMEYISHFQPEDIDNDDIDLRFEADGVDTGCDVSIVDQCGKAANLIDLLIAALEQAQQNHRLHAARLINERASLKNRIAELEAAPNGMMQLPAAQIKWDGSQFSVQNVRDGFSYGVTDVYTQPVGFGQLSNELAEMKRKCVELKASHHDLRESMAAIHNTIRGNVAYVSLSVLLTATENAWSKSASAAAITVECNDVITCWSCNKSMTLLERSGADGFCPHCDVEIDMQDDRRRASTVEGE